MQTTFSKEFAKSLSQSIEMEGLHHPITLRPNPDKPGRYLLVAGRHRLNAVHKCLKRDVIEAKVIVDMDETDAEMATIAENLWRNPLKKAQHHLAIQKWHEHYAAEYPPKLGSNAGSVAAKKKAAERRTAKAEGAEGEPENPKPYVGLGSSAGRSEPEKANASEADVPSFARLVSHTTGEGLSSAKVTAKLARTFNPDQIEVFEQMQVGRVDMHTIAKIKNAQHRDEIINLIASGMDAREAIAQVLKPEDGAVKLGNGRIVPAPASPGRPEGFIETDMPDQVWLETYCAEIRKLLPPEARAKFDLDAVAYRELRSAHNTFKSKMKNLIQVNGSRGAFLRRAVARVCNLAHPKVGSSAAGAQAEVQPGTPQMHRLLRRRLCDSDEGALIHVGSLDVPVPSLSGGRGVDSRTRGINRHSHALRNEVMKTQPPVV